MGQYRSAVITDAGQALLADAISESGTVTFSAIKTSSYAYPQGTNIAGLTDLQDIVQTVTPFSVQVFNDTMLQVSARFDNSDVASAYLIQTLGAYAQIVCGGSGKYSRSDAYAKSCVSIGIYL